MLTNPSAPCVASIDRTQHVGCFLNVLDGEPLEQVAGRAVVLLQHAGDGVIVFV